MPTIAAAQASVRICAARLRSGGSALFRGAPAFRRSAAALARANASAVGSAPVPAFPETHLTGITRFDLSQVYLAPRRPVVVPVERWLRAARHQGYIRDYNN